MAERVCSNADNLTNAIRAREIGSGRPYGRAFVEVLAVDPAAGKVTVLTPAAGGGPVELTFAWTRDNVWAACPSTLDCDETRLPAPGATGMLYLSNSLVRDNRVVVKYKWPDDLPADPEYRTLRIWPTSIQLRGVELATGTLTSGTIDLMDPNIAQPGQTLALEDGPLTLSLSQAGFFQFLAPWISLEALRRATDLIGGREGKRGGTTSSARDLARAWAQVAAWEELLGGEPSRRSEEHVTARRLLDQIAR